MNANASTRPPALPLAITMGDPAGIGPEIIAQWATARGTGAAPYVVVGDVGALQRAAATVGAPLQVRPVGDQLEGLHEALRQGALPVLQACAPLPADLPMGRVDARAGAAAHACVQRAIDLALAGSVAGIVTAPLHKEALRAAGVLHPGHTEMLAERAGTTDFAMMLANSELRVLLVSIHLALRDAIAAVTPESELRAIRLAHRACRAYGIAQPRVAVAGLNPHAGEGGLFGHEDRDIIAPAIAAARAEGIDATGPWPGDTVFMRARQGAFDIVVAQYHDQGLIPVKYLGVDQGVNITVGLPFVRTSVDHGTAFDIAGTGRADASSLGHAVDQAVAMVTATQATPPPGQPLPEFIFMLTRHDQTITDALGQLPAVLAAGVRHIGFKDIGLPWAALQRLADAIHAAGAVSYLEVVSQDEASEVASARAAVALGVDVLMGGTRPEAVLPLLRGTPIRYYPFAGRVVGHPSVLQGTVEDVVASARRIAALEGVHGLDLLAYRFAGDAAEVPALMAAVCSAVDKPVVIAGSIDRAERIAAVVAGQAAGFTVGTAALDGAFEVTGVVPHGLAGQLCAIQTVLQGAVAQA
ncbi:4-hydroxythreonine-4-phosphate dehydrogenase [Acidovorax sp. CF316]|uniref:4-hydroxythreonine-4-phosphate dehydrogenase PdxA n=1 Tax=Acidovorax sp. CF316 TaxID=1144317 RepID=UPI00026BC040|nr:4-hydroxythreonine-4-phosphate dehydrogenase PdxA [Acidovorax sp. CF316]EJE48530.1 4-hydroxythreonine-4-phosphate dehydrogenase [Acidovorax sp. CF316]